MVKCGLCGLEFDRITAPHLKHKHGLNSIIEYWEECPGAPTCSEESSKRTSEANSGYEPTPETIRKLRESHMGIEQSEETKELHRKSSLAMWAGRSKEEKQDILGRGFRSEEAQIKVANKTRKRYENMTDEERYASTASLRDPEMVKRRAASLQEYWDGKSYEERQECYRNSFGSKEAKEAQREGFARYIRNLTEKDRRALSDRMQDFWNSLSPEEKADKVRNSFQHPEVKEERRRKLARMSQEERDRVAAPMNTKKARAKAMQTQRFQCSNMSWIERREMTEGWRRKGKVWWENMDPKEKQRRIDNLQAAFKEDWERLSPEEKSERMKPLIEAGQQSQVSPNKTEAQLWKFLDQAFPDMFVPTWIDHICIGGKYPDFISRDGHKVVIETMGAYRHEYEDEEARISLYKGLGWDCIVIWAATPEDIIAEWPSLANQIKGMLRRIRI